MIFFAQKGFKAFVTYVAKPTSDGQSGAFLTLKLYPYRCSPLKGEEQLIITRG